MAARLLVVDPDETVARLLYDVLQGDRDEEAICSAGRAFLSSTQMGAHDVVTLANVVLDRQANRVSVGEPRFASLLWSTTSQRT